MPLFLYFPELASLGEKPPRLDKNGARDRVASLHTQPSSRSKKSMSSRWQTDLTNGFCWMNVSRVFGLAMSKEKAFRLKLQEHSSH